ncbi:MAG: DUF1501 domain-containing protein [Gemmataceae bacterium]|nr:DUF1501 domain-containing protein [Gemmataceae bacterium]
MTLNSSCGSPEHPVSRRGFLTSLAAMAGTAAVADMTAIQVLGAPAVANELRQQQKRVIMLWLAGGSSQLETFDPKPGVPTGGPFQSIQTSTPGIRISELMPKMARRMRDTTIIRSLNTRNADHGSAAKIMMRGRMSEADIDYPDLGAVMSREMGLESSQVPDYVSFYTATEGRSMAPGHAGFLGARYGSMDLTTSMVPENIRRVNISELDHRERSELRNQLSGMFERGRSSSSLDSHNQAYRRVSGIMANEQLFDIEREPQRVRDRYGPTLFGRQALAARRLCEAGVPFIRVGRAWWDTHAQNFESHQEMVPELDHVMSTLLDDLDERGLLRNTLIVTLAEFGRTPSINSSVGRDHFASAWSTTLSGCGIRGGTVYGRSDASGNRVAEGEIGAARLFATIYRALGINPHKNYYIGARPIPLTDPGTEPIREVLA